jgi:SAM-dependent methyltransferase
VLAVEPVAAMRARLGELGPLVTPVDAAAEALPFEAGSTGCALAAQSLHWTDVPAALAELDRVLRPGAGIGLIWNFRDVAVPWQRDLDALLGHLRGDVPHSRDGRWQRAVEASAFEVAASQTRRWSLPTDDRGVVERVRSVSYVAALPEEAQRRVDERVLRVLRRHGLRPGEVEFPYVTETYVLRRRPGGST